MYLKTGYSRVPELSCRRHHQTRCQTFPFVNRLVYSALERQT